MKRMKDMNRAMELRGQSRSQMEFGNEGEKAEASDSHGHSRSTAATEKRNENS
jgi:hypothetical protein